MGTATGYHAASGCPSGAGGQPHHSILRAVFLIHLSELSLSLIYRILRLPGAVGDFVFATLVENLVIGSGNYFKLTDSLSSICFREGAKIWRQI